MKKKPNILLITTDQQHADTIQGLGNPAIQTPNLDRLVHEGVSFDRAYVANPVCSPSRSSILTGQYPSQHGCWNIGVSLPEEKRTLSQALSEHGYETVLFGKAHFKAVLSEESFEAPPHIFDRDFWRHWDGPYYGFQKVAMVHGHADELSSQGMHYGAWLEEQGVDTGKYFGPKGYHREGSWDLPEELHYTRWTANQTIEFLQHHNNRNEQKPFFAWCSFQDPHNSYLVQEPWASMYNPDTLPDFIRQEGEMDDKTILHQCAEKNDWGKLKHASTAHPHDPSKKVQSLGWETDEVGEKTAKQWKATYYGMVSLIDHHLGRIMDTLKQQNLDEDTLVIFTSDHGDYLGNHGIWLKGPLHYEDIIRVPFIARWTSTLPQHARSNSLISLVDLAPTILDFCGLSGAMNTEGITQRETFLHPDQAQRGWCLVENRAEENIYVKTLVTGQYKLNYHLNSGETELYDLINDPHEFVNLASDQMHASTLSSMLCQLLDIYGRMEGPYPPRLSFA